MEINQDNHYTDRGLT